MKFLPTNEFVLSLPNPVKNPNVIALKLTKRSKRNLLIKHGLLPIVLLAALPVVNTVVDGVLDAWESDVPLTDETPDTPTED